jgi:GH15 family glucan-1,4-alpha-glucosidase
MIDYGLIGNCQISALVSKTGSMDWLCMPRPDSDPVLGRLLDEEGGEFSVEPAAGIRTSHQHYIDNTNVLVTEVETSSGDAYRITDFAPRFEQHGRTYRPTSVNRIIEPIRGRPVIRVAFTPVEGWSRTQATPIRGNSHLRFDFRANSLRLTTSMPITYLTEGTAFSLQEKLYFAVTWSTAVEEELVQLVESQLARTTSYWCNWVKHCSIPSLFQKETIRSALALKLHCYEDTGAILAATTTSLPEEHGNQRNWDYRFCWLRDSYFVLSAFHNLGHFEEMEGFLKFFLGIAERQGDDLSSLAPVYSLDRELPLPEILRAAWRGHRGSGPVRTNNQAAEHVQNDVYGEMILTLSPIYFDERFVHLRTRDHDRLMARLALLCSKSISTPDAGLWELRNGWQEHSFTNLMCWAGLERVSRIERIRKIAGGAISIDSEARRALEALDRATRQGALRNGPTDDSFDAALSLAAVLRHPEPKIALATVRDIQNHLSLGTERPHRSFLYRYLRQDDFGRPGSAFLICSFWVAQALARLEQRDEARTILEDAVRAANEVGLFAEHYDPERRVQLGNFPQAYSHVGLINAAFAVSPPWSEIL